MGKQSISPSSCRTCAPLRIACVLLLALCCLHSPAQTAVSAIATPLLLPSAIVFDAQGNLYVAETANHVIRKIDRSGNLTTIAGTGTQGFGGDGGPATAAQLDSPQGLALDANQNLYIADTHNHRIRKLSLTTGIINTVAGTGIAGFAGDHASATAAQLNLPTALALDAQQNLYLADTASHRVRKIDAVTGLITTVAGDGTQGFAGDNGLATAASIDSPTGIAVDGAGNLYLADTHNHRIRMIAATTGLITTVAGTGVEAFSGDNAAASGAAVALPHGLSLDTAGNLYLADTANHRIRRIDAATGQITTVAGDGTQALAGDNGPATAASLNSPRAVVASAIAPLTLADTGNQRIRQVDAASIQTVVGTGGTTVSAHSDFTLAATGASSQTIVSGSAASFAFSVAMQGDPLSSPIALAATGLPRLATASFNPAYLPPGASSSAFTLTITVPATAARNRAPAASPLFFAILCLPLCVSVRRSGRHKRQTLLALLLLTAALSVCSGCGDRIRLGSLATPSATPYTVTVSGTATTPAGTVLQHFATVTLLIQAGS